MADFDENAFYHGDVYRPRQSMGEPIGSEQSHNMIVDRTKLPINPGFYGTPVTTPRRLQEINFNLHRQGWVSGGPIDHRPASTILEAHSVLENRDADPTGSVLHMLDPQHPVNIPGSPEHEPKVYGVPLASPDHPFNDPDHRFYQGYHADNWREINDNAQQFNMQNQSSPSVMNGPENTRELVPLSMQPFGSDWRDIHPGSAYSPANFLHLGEPAWPQVYDSRLGHTPIDSPNHPFKDPDSPHYLGNPQNPWALNHDPEPAPYVNPLSDAHPVNDLFGPHFDPRMRDFPTDSPDHPFNDSTSPYFQINGARPIGTGEKDPFVLPSHEKFPRPDDLIVRNVDNLATKLIGMIESGESITADLKTAIASNI